MKNETRVLHVLDVYKSYGDKLILDNIDLSVKMGELCTLVGPSGSGKSTVLRLVLGQELPTAGRLLIDGEAVGFPDPSRGIVFQRYSLFPIWAAGLSCPPSTTRTTGEWGRNGGYKMGASLRAVFLRSRLRPCTGAAGSRIGCRCSAWT